MANTESKKLAVDVIARVDKLERAMAKAAKATSTGMGKVEARTKKAASTVASDMQNMAARMNSALGTIGKGLGAVGVGIGITAAFNQIRDSIRDLSQVSADAKMAGLGAETFQELKYAAEQSKVGVDAVTDGIKELQLRADEFAVTGKGSAAEAFQRIGMTKEEVKERLKDPADMINEIMNRVGKLSTAARIRILDELFGGQAGEQFIRFLERGEDGINALRQEARETGNVLGEDVIKKAAELDKRFNQVSSTVATQLKGAIVAAADALGDFLAMLPGAEVPIEDIGRRSIEITREIIALENQLGDARKYAETAGTDIAKFRVEQIEKSIAALKAEDALLQRRGHAAVAERDRRAAFDVPRGEYRGGNSVADTTANAQSAFDRVSEAIAKRTELLKVEAATVGESAAARDRARITIELETAARKANEQAGLKNTEVTEKQRQAIEKLADGYFKAREAVEAANAPLAAWARESANVSDQLENLAVSSLDRIADDFGDIVAGTKSVEDAFRSMAQSIIAELAKIAIKQAVLGPLAALMGGGGGGMGGGGLLGSLFGFADGGPTPAGPRNKAVGIVHAGEVVWSQRDVARAGGVAVVEAMRRGVRGYADGGPVLPRFEAPRLPKIAGAAGGNAVSAPVSINIDARGADREGLARVEMQVARLKAELPAAIIHNVRDAQRRRAL